MKTLSAKVTNADLGWLAGIIDGEGHIFVRPQSQRGKGHIYMVGITNTDMGIIGNVSKIYKKMGIHHRIASTDPNKYKASAIQPKAGFKIVYHIEICREADVRLLLTTISRFLRQSQKVAKTIQVLSTPSWIRKDGWRSNRRKLKMQPTQLELVDCSMEVQHSHL